MGFRHLYVHVPFCRRRCSYCDFSIAVRRNVPGKTFIDTILRELTLRVEDLGDSVEPLASLYLGGGTPSLLSTDELERLIDAVRRVWAGGGSPDITLEANPEDINDEVARAWKEIGIGRVSVGVQSLCPEVLAWMHRTHTDHQALAALEVLQRAEIRSISADVIFGLPESLNADPVGDAEKLVGYGVSHLSAYGLTVEPHTPLARWQARGSQVDGDDEAYAEQFCEIHGRLVIRGFEHYEISNYALPGHRSIHNQAYWNEVPFLGVGPAAHSYRGGERWWNVRPWAEYEEMMGAGCDPTAGRERLSEEQRWLEALYLGLRTAEGLDAVNTRRLDAEPLERFMNLGYLVRDGERGGIRATLEGWLRLDEVVSRLTTSDRSG